MSERPNPTSIVICTLIALYLDPSSPLEDVLNDDDAAKQELLNLLQLLVRKTYFPLSDVIQPLHKPVSLILLETLEDASVSVDGLVDLIISIQTIDVDGELGIYVRKMCLGFDKLSFESMTRLWEAFKLEVKACVDSSKNKSHVNILPKNIHGSLSPQQKQNLIRLKCLNLDEDVSKIKPEELAPQVQSILEQEREIPASHFLKFLNNLEKGSKFAALDALHQYFDYAMIAERKYVFKRQIILHYATLVLAAVHQQFGDEELSEKATEEAIHVAQQSGDPACVAHALSLLHQTTGNRDILQRCAVRALQGKLRRLIAGANLKLALTAQNSSQAWEALLCATTDKKSLTIDRPTYIGDVTSPEEAMEILGQTALVSASIWETIGFQFMCTLTTEVGLECYGNYLTYAAKDSAVQNLARKFLSGALLVENKNKFCRYGLALNQVIDQGNSFGTSLLVHEWGVRRGDYGHAEVLIEHLYSRLHSRMTNFKLSEIEVMTQHALLLARRGWTVAARSKIKYLIDKCKRERLVIQEANLLILLTITQLDANIDEFLGAVKPIRECLKLTMERNMDILHATATSIMAQLHYRMSRTDTCISIIKGILPTLQQNGNIWFVAEAYLTLAKCYLRLDEGTNLSTTTCKSILTTFLKSGVYFTQCQDFVKLREVYYWQARMYSSIKNFKKRDEAAEKFIDISKKLAKGSAATDLGELDDCNYLQFLSERRVHSWNR